MDAPFARTADVYDLLYEAAGKDYGSDAAGLHGLIQARRPGAGTLLDVACGTGAHLARLAEWYAVAGVDIEPSMLAVARRRLPAGVPLVAADMRTLALRRRFDAVVCLFSAIGYMRSPAELDAAVAAMAGHLTAGGVLVVDGWIRPGDWQDPGVLQALAAGDGDLVAARVGLSRRDGRRTRLEFQHLIGDRERGIEHVVECHELTLFGDDEYRHAFLTAGLTVDVVPSPHAGRDRYVGTATA